MKKSWRSILATILCLAMVVGYLPAYLRADNESTDTVGENAPEIVEDQEESQESISENEYGIVSITCNNSIEIPEFTCGYYDIEENSYETDPTRYYRYSLETYFSMNFCTFTIVYENGERSFTGEYYQIYERFGENISFSSNQYDPGFHWRAGNTYTVEASLLGFSTSINVSIVDNRVKNISCDDVVRIPEKYVCGHQTDVGYYYDIRMFMVNSDTRFTITYEDDTTASATCLSIGMRGGDIDVDDKFQYESPMLVGNQYDVDFTCLGVEGSLVVEIVPSDVISITASGTLPIVEHTGGWDYNDSDYYYNPANAIINSGIVFDITLASGEVITGTYNSIYESTGYTIGFSTNQNMEVESGEKWIVGETYTVELSFMDCKCGTMNVSIVPNDVESIESSGVLHLTEGVDGYYNGDYFVYVYYYRTADCALDDSIEFTVHYSDGKEDVVGTYYEIYEAANILINGFSDTQEMEHWTVGNRYEVQYTYCGVTGTMLVEIDPAPVVEVDSIECNGVLHLLENVDGQIVSTGESDYFCYEYKRTGSYGEILNAYDLEFTVHYTNGYSVSGSCDYLNMSEGLWLTFSDTQEEQPWSVEGENYITVHCRGCEESIPVIIDRNPVVNISCDQTIELVEYTNGYWDMYNGYEFYHYYASETYSLGDGTDYLYDDFYGYSIILNVTLDDGSTLIGNLNTIASELRVPISISEDQWNQHWSSENEQSVVLSCGGCSITIPVVIVPNPVSSISVNPGSIEIYENTHGYYQDIWNDNGEISGQYYCYFVSDLLANSTFDITYNDGRGTISYSWWELGELGYGLSYYDDQSQYNQWGTGMHTITCNLLEREFVCTVVIVSSPVESITCDDVIHLRENVDGWLSWSGDQEFFYYDYRKGGSFGEILNKYDFQLTINYRNGESFTGTCDEINMTQGWLSFEDDQYVEPWTVSGENNYITVKFKGQTGTIPVVIDPDPIADITCLSTIEYIENTDGDWVRYNGEEFYYYDDNIYWNYLSDGGVEYQTYYGNDLLFRVAFNDGRDPIEGNAETICSYTGVSLYLDTGNQYDSHWTVNGEQYICAFLGGCSCTIPVVIHESPVESITCGDLHLQERYDGYFITDENGEEYFNYYVFGDVNRPIYQLPITVHFKDGRPDFNCTLGNRYEDTEFFVWLRQEDVLDAQGEEHWVPGQSYPLRITFMGAETMINVIVDRNPLYHISSISCSETLDINEDGPYSYWSYSPEVGYYKYYDVRAALYANEDLLFTVSFDDGSAPIIGNYQDICETLGYGLYFDRFVEEYQCQWEPGGVYAAYYDIDEIFGGSLQVHIVPKFHINTDSIMSLSCEGKLHIMKNSIGYYQYDEQDEAFFYYNLSDVLSIDELYGDLQFILTYMDGEEIKDFKGTLNDLLNVTDLDYGVEDTQWENHWQPGQSYSATVMLGEFTTDLTVCIDSSSKFSELICDTEEIYIDVTDSDIGEYDFDEYGDLYFRYYFGYDFEFTLIGLNGEVISGTRDEIYAQTGYYVEINENQFFEHWYPGETYDIEVNYLDLSTTIRVTLSESPISSLSVSPDMFTITENSFGRWEYDYIWNEEIQDDELVEQFYYDPMYFMTTAVCTINYKDPDVDPDVFNIRYEDNNPTYRVFSKSSAQVDQNSKAWGTGTHEVCFYYMGYEWSVIVDIVSNDNPVVAIEPNGPFTIVDKPYAGTSSYYGYYHYDLYLYDDFGYSWNDPTFTLTREDGTTFVGNAEEVYLEFGHYITIDDPQSIENTWTVGNTYPVQIHFGDLSATLMYEIVPVGVRVETQNLNYLSPALREDGYTVDIVKDMFIYGTQTSEYAEENRLFLDAVPEVCVGEDSWETIDNTDYMEKGMRVRFDYPEGTDATYDFVIAHMFTVSTMSHGVGELEIFREGEIEKASDGLYVTIHGASPFMIAWKEGEQPSQNALIKGASLSLTGDISINFKVVAPYSGTKAVLTYSKDGSNKTIEYDLDPEAAYYSDFYTESTGVYKLVFPNIPAKEMTEIVSLKIYDADGKQINLEGNSGRIYEQFDYSVKTWCDNKINDPKSTSKTVNLAKALLNYGQCAQVYFNYNLDNPANPNGYYADQMNQVVYSDLYRIQRDDELVSQGIYKSASLNLGGTVSVTLKFNVPVRIRYKGGEYDSTLSSDQDYYYFTIGNIVAKDLGVMPEVTVIYGENEYNLSYCPLTWANNMINKHLGHEGESGYNESTLNIAKSIVLYNQAAKEYFGI